MTEHRFNRVLLIAAAVVLGDTVDRVDRSWGGVIC
jgi:hypothetical protein